MSLSPSVQEPAARPRARPTANRSRVLVIALRPVSRAIWWPPLVAGTAGAVALVAAVRLDGPDSSRALAGMRAAGVMLAAGAAFALDDKAAATLSAVPTTRRARRGQRLLVALGPVAAVWILLATVAGGLPLAAATLEAAAMVAVALAVAALASRWSPDGLGGIAGGPGLIFLLLAAFLAQHRWPRYAALLPAGPGDPTWNAAHGRWACLLLLAAVVLVATAADPARRRRGS